MKFITLLLFANSSSPRIIFKTFKPTLSVACFCIYKDLNHPRVFVQEMKTCKYSNHNIRTDKNPELFR